MPETTTNALTVIAPKTGEIIDVRNAASHQLADVVAEIAEARDRLGEIERVVEAELLRRLDKAGAWTYRVTSGDVLHEIKAPSPQAGSTAVRVDVLRDELVALIKADKIERDLGRRALKRTITISAQVDVDAVIDGAIDRLRAIDKIAGIAVFDVAVGTDEKVAQDGLNALRKAGHGEAVDRATVEVSPPARRVKVKTQRAGG